MSTLLRVCFSTVLLISLGASEATPAAASASVMTYSVDGIKITVIVPGSMQVNIVPIRLTSEDGMLALHYTFTTWEREVMYAVEWSAVFSNSAGKIELERQWGEWGEWAAGSTVNEKAFFDRPKTPDMRITLVVQKVLSDTYAKSCDATITNDVLRKVLFEGDASGFRTTTVKNISLSGADERELLIRSFTKITELDSLNQDLGVSAGQEGQYYYRARDGYELPASLPMFRPLTSAKLTAKSATGERVRHFEYGGFAVSGDNVELLINYHTPPAGANYRGAKGIHLTFIYHFNQGRFEFKGIKTEHF